MLTREQYIAAAWKAGELSWKLRPEQKKLKAELEKPAVQLCVFNISRRLGKTFTLVTYCLEQALRSKQKIRYGTAFLTDLEEFVLPAFYLLLDDCPERVRPRYNGTKKTWLFPNGSEIKLVGVDRNPNGMRGNAMNIVVIDEAGFVEKLQHVHKNVIIPATAKQKNIKLVFISTPPESPEHYFVDLIHQAQTEAFGHYATLTIDDISDLEPSERKRLLDGVGGENSPTARREFFCRIEVDASRAICQNFKLEKHVGISNSEHVAWRLFGDTGGVRDMTVFLEAGFDLNTRKVLIRSELAFKHSTATTTIQQAIKEKYPGMTIVMDAPGQLAIDYAAAGLVTAPVQKDDFGAGLLQFDTAFHNDEVLIDPSCALLLRTLTGGLLNRQRTDYERSEKLGHCDAAAALVYAIRGVDRVTDLRPKPKRSEVFKIETDPPHIQQIKGLSHARR